MITDLNENTYIMYAVKAYDKPNCIMAEFEEDLKRLKYVKRLIKRYRQTKELKERLILNHIIVLANVFGVEATVRLLFYKIDKVDYHILKTFLLYLNYMPNVVKSIKGKNITSSDISIDLEVGRLLRNL